MVRSDHRFPQRQISEPALFFRSEDRAGIARFRFGIGLQNSNNLDIVATDSESRNVRSWTAIIMVACFLGIGSGALEYIHNLQHAAEDAREDAIARANGQPTEQHHHDENNCEVHAQIHMAIIVYAWTPLLIWLGIWIAFLTLLAVPLIPRLLPARIDCRGPPCALLSV
jgi:hypothetical protein